MNDIEKLKEIARARINQETSQIRWSELQRFFAAGKLVFVDDSLDLIEVAVQLEHDNKQKFEEWMQGNLVGQVTDDQAIRWHEDDTLLWAVVIKPWVLVQERAGKA
jgi:hypothetical protein